jgi:hypothetical protein
MQEGVAEAMMFTMMHLEEAAAKMDLVVLVAEKVGFPLFKAPQVNLQRPMAEMGAMGAEGAAAQAAATTRSILPEREGDIQVAAEEGQPIIMAAAAAAPTTPVPTPPPPAVSKVETGRLSLPIKLEWLSPYQPLPVNFRMPL